MLKIINIFVTYFGITTILVFLLFVALGNIQNSEHAFLLPEISYFISPYMTGNAVVFPLYLIYISTLLLFSLGLLIRMHNKYARLGAINLAFSAITGILLIYYPMDHPNMPQTVYGLIHVLFVLIMTVFIMIALLLFGKGFEHMKNLSWLASYSHGISIALFCGSFVTAIIAYFNRSLVGLLERLPIAAFLAWILLVAIGIFYSDRRIKY